MGTVIPPETERSYYNQKLNNNSKISERTNIKRFKRRISLILSVSPKRKITFFPKLSIMFETKSNLTHNIGYSGHKNEIVGKGKCPFCSSIAGMKQLTRSRNSDYGKMVPLKCSVCESIVLWKDGVLLPNTGEYERLEGLPENLQELYDEAVDCLEAGAPNGSSAVFRRLINAIGVHFKVINEDENGSFKGIIEDLEKEGHIRNVSSEVLDSVREIGNDGSHINENKPDIEQVEILKQLIEIPLESIKTKERIEELEKKSNAN